MQSRKSDSLEVKSCAKLSETKERIDDWGTAAALFRFSSRETATTAFVVARALSRLSPNMLEVPVHMHAGTQLEVPYSFDIDHLIEGTSRASA